MYVHTDRSKVIIVCYSHSYYNRLSWLGERKKKWWSYSHLAGNTGGNVLHYWMSSVKCVTSEKMVRSLPNGKNGWVTRWSQCRLSGKCYGGSMCTDHETAKIRVTRRKVFLEEEVLGLYFRGRRRVLQAENGWKSNRTEGDIQDKKRAMAVGGEGRDVVTCLVCRKVGLGKIRGAWLVCFHPAERFGF